MTAAELLGVACLIVSWLNFAMCMLIYAEVIKWN